MVINSCVMALCAPNGLRHHPRPSAGIPLTAFGWGWRSDPTRKMIRHRKLYGFVESYEAAVPSILS
ncbi:MAG: hypothetical protein Q7U53_05430 [Anaerolineaceae bacterium]|nr:hypothetical protein [Anaerolineaceae bacterium]